LDFLAEQEIEGLFIELGITTSPHGEECFILTMDDDHAHVKHCLDNESCLPCGGDEKTHCFNVLPELMTEKVICAIHKIHEGRTLMLPTSKWRSIFDVVAFSMATDESWQEFDASATIKLNTRDPLLFEGGDEQTLVGLVTALMNDGEAENQGVYLIPVGAPLLLHIQPGGPVKLYFGNDALADEVKEAYTA